MADCMDAVCQRRQTLVVFKRYVQLCIIGVFPVWAAILLFPVVGRCCSHFRTLSLNSWRSKTHTLTLEFWRYPSQFQRYKYFRFGRQYCYFRFSVADAITRCTFFELAVVENSRIVVGISTLSIVVPDIKVFPVWATILLFPVFGR